MGVLCNCLVGALPYTHYVHEFSTLIGDALRPTGVKLPRRYRRLILTSTTQRLAVKIVWSSSVCLLPLHFLLFFFFFRCVCVFFSLSACFGFVFVVCLEIENALLSPAGVFLRRSHCGLKVEIIRL